MFDIRTELYYKQDEFILNREGSECEECGERTKELDIEAIAQWIEDNKHNF